MQNKIVENPFFSIVIPCYNSKNTIARLLQSIVDQHMSDDIEVILADDHSKESYENEIKRFYNKLYIKRIMTDYNCCPGNTREKGVTLVNGKWLIFADHDDVFIQDTFKTIKDTLIEYNEQNIAYCHVYRAKNTNGKFDNSLIEQEIGIFSELLHGKIFNVENFWKKYDIHFKKDLFTHEDTYIIHKIKCIMEINKIKALHLKMSNYVWFDNKKSLSNKNGVDNFLEDNFDCFIQASSEVYKFYYSKGLIDDNFAVYNLISIFLQEYFFMQKFLFLDPTGFKKENLELCQNDLIYIKKIFNLSNNDIFWYCANNNCELYTRYSKGFMYIPMYSISEWMTALDND
jgi:glycosyltransferase involved in cell wall biosynthesis